MSSIPLGQLPSINWNDLAHEIRQHILEDLIQYGCTLSRLATVSREWQREFERHNFARIRIRPARLADFDSMTRRNRALVRYIWFCLELPIYDCPDCEREEAYYVEYTTHGLIASAFQTLFEVLGTWDPSEDLVLDISVYSPSDSAHYFPYTSVLPDDPSNPNMVGDTGIQHAITQGHDDSRHGWVAGFRQRPPPKSAFKKVFYSTMMRDGPFGDARLEREWWDQLPLVPAVTSVLLRQQNRRRWRPRSFAEMLRRLPRLRETHYEPWRPWDISQFQERRDAGE